MDKHSNENYKHFNIKQYTKTIQDGFRIIATSLGLSEAKTEQRKKFTQHDIPEKCDDCAKPLLYGYSILAKLFSTIILWVPSFILDVKVGLHPSKKFAMCSYIVGIIGSIAGIIIANILFAPMMEQVLPGLIQRVASLLVGIAVISEMVYVLFAFISLVYITYHRVVIHQFIVNRVSNIFVPERFQHETAVRIFISALVCGALAEPLFALLSIKENFHPTLLSSLSKFQNTAIRLGVMFATLVCANCLNSLSNVVPIITCWMSCATAEYVRLSVQKQVSRLIGSKLGAKLNQHAHYDDSLIEEFAIKTLDLDWPDEIRPQQVKKQRSREESVEQAPAVISHHWRQRARGQSLKFGDRLFLYKNLIKIFSDLRGMIEAYESIFGRFHCLAICLNGLLLAQWIVAGIVQYRLGKSNINANKDDDHDTSAAASDSPLTPHIVQTFISVLVFATSNIITFVRCDRLPCQINKVRSQLITINLDLVGIYHHQHDSPSSETHLCWPEVELVWALYDQVDRLAEQVNFKLIGNTYYSKRCLLLIFTRETSLILLYIQLIDIYNNV